MEERFAQQAQERALARPVAPTLPAQPDLRARAFLEPGKDVLGGMQTAMLAIGQLAMGIAGQTGRGYAIAATSALKGALEGWQVGDQTRIQDGLAQWRLASDNLLREYTAKHQQYQDLLTDQKLSNDEKFAVVELRAKADGNLIQADIARRQDLQALHENLEKEGALASQLVKYQWTVDKYAQQQKRLMMDPKVVRWIETHLHEDPLTASDEVVNAAIKGVEQEDKRLRLEKLEEKEAEQKRMLAAREEEQKRLREFTENLRADVRHATKREAEAKGMFYDRERGEVRQISQGELEDDLAATKGGAPQRFRHLSTQESQLVDRLKIAKPILDRLDQLVPRILAEAKGQNLTQGLVNRIAGQLGLSADIAEFQAINADQVIEQATALSGGPARIAVLKLLMNHATPQDYVTADVARRQIATARTTIGNRLTGLTYDPEAMTRLAAPMRAYGRQPGPKPGTYVEGGKVYTDDGKNVLVQGAKGWEWQPVTR